MMLPVGLVVDDDPQVRAFLAETLRRGGMQIFVAESASEALTLAQTIEPSFVVTDVEMPGMNGLELCRQLRRSAATEKLIIVLVSGATTQGDAATAAGCDAVLAKPCSPALLVATIRQLLVKPS